MYRKRNTSTQGCEFSREMETLKANEQQRASFKIGIEIQAATATFTFTSQALNIGAWPMKRFKVLAVVNWHYL